MHGSSEVEPLNTLDDGRYGPQSVCPCKLGNRRDSKTNFCPRKGLESNKTVSVSHHLHQRKSERCACITQVVSKITLPVSVILNLFLVSLLTYILVSLKSNHHQKDKGNGAQRLSADAVCFSCANLDPPFPWEWRFTYGMHVVMVEDGSMCCVRQCKYTQILIKIMQFAHSKRPHHSILNSHLAGISKGDEMANFKSLSMGKVKYRAEKKNAIQVQNDTVIIYRPDMYHIYAQLTIHWDHVHGKHSGPKNIKLSLNRKGCSGREELVFQNIWILERSIRGQIFRTLTIFESVWLQRGDVLYLKMNEPSMVYRSYESNVISVIS